MTAKGIKRLMTILIALALILAALIVALWAGLRVKPGALPAYPEQTPPLETRPLPDDLPAPVARFYQAIAGDAVPVINSAVISGPARLRLGGITFNGRYRFTHLAGQDYRHYIELTLFGQPVIKVNEHYLDGHARQELPFGTTENEPKVDAAANQGLWGESIWLPGIFLTDPRVRWEAVDDTTARLIVPFGDEEQTFTATFDPATGLLVAMETLRYKDKDGDLVGWRLEMRGWARFHGLLIPSPAAAIWADEGTAWAVFTVEDVAYNVDVTDYVRARGL